MLMKIRGIASSSFASFPLALQMKAMVRVVKIVKVMGHTQNTWAHKGDPHLTTQN